MSHAPPAAPHAHRAVLYDERVTCSSWEAGAHIHEVVLGDKLEVYGVILNFYLSLTTQTS